MPKTRRKLSTTVKDFKEEMDRLIRLDMQNQARFSFRRSKHSITKKQLHLLTEAIFFGAFRAYENLIRDVFLLYSLEMRPSSGVKVISYLNPKNFLHAERLIQSAMRFLDWKSPDIVIERSELYLEDGFPVKIAWTTNRQSLIELKRIRNHIAHNSKESLEEYKKVLKNHYTTLPLKIPEPGEFLLSAEKKGKKKYKLLTYFDILKKVADDLS